MFASMDDPEMLYVPFIFDAAYCFVISANEMLNAGVDVTNIKRKALLTKCEPATLRASAELRWSSMEMVIAWLPISFKTRRLVDG
jgi:hypothetical protein